MYQARNRGHEQPSEGRNMMQRGSRRMLIKETLQEEGLDAIASPPKPPSPTNLSPQTRSKTDRLAASKAQEIYCIIPFQAK